MSAKDHVGWRSLFLRRLGSVSPLSEGAASLVGELKCLGRTLPPDAEIRADAGTMAVVAWGSAYRYRMLADGRRVVFDVLLPGDLIELSTPAMESDLAAAASNKLDLVFVRQAQLKRLSEANPEFGKAIAMTTQADSLRLMAHVMRLSRLTAYERVAHFLLEIHDRLSVIGLAPNGRFQMPINQIVLSDALGMTRFHVNRTLRRLRTDGWVELNQQVVHLRDAEALADLCEYKRWHPVA